MTDLDDTLGREVGIAATGAARPRPWHEIHERGRRVRRRRAAAAVGAVAVVATVATVAGPLMDAGGGRPIGPAGHVAHLVPWKPIPPTRARISQSAAPARPDSALARNAKPCVPADLTVESRLDGAGGRWILDLVVRTTSTRPCRVQGNPVLSFVRDGSRPLQVPQEPATGSANDYREPVLLDAEHQASVEVAWSTTGCPQGSEPARPALTLPGREGWAIARAVKASPLCTSGEVSSEPVAVGPFRPTRYTPARARSVYAAVRARITDTHPDAVARRVGFQVSLTTPRSTALVPCPDYTVVVAGRAGSVERRYALNCAAVPYLDGKGHAYLPAHKPVTFAMQVPLTPALAEEADLKLVWELQVPENVGGAVSVDPRG